MKALIVGGTGPSGPHIVNGLIRRGYDVTVLHGGQHEAEFIQPVEHVHTDPHFTETLAPALDGRKFDVAIATYGRIRLVADVLRGKTPRLIAAGGGGVYARRDDPRWGGLGQPQIIPEDSPRNDDPNGPRFGHLMWVTEETIMKAHKEGLYNATTFRYPMVYGPNSPANPDWSVVRRLLEGRTQIILPSNGAIKRRGYGENTAHAVLLAVDKPKESAGQSYNIRDDKQFTQRQTVEFIAKRLKKRLEIIEMPPAIAAKVYKGEGANAGGGIEFDINKLKTQLGYRDVVDPAEALARSVDWLLANPPEPGGEIERQIGDPFAYELEDELIEAYQDAMAKLQAIQFPEFNTGHMYRHPKKPGEAWSPPSR